MQNALVEMELEIVVGKTASLVAKMPHRPADLGASNRIILTGRPSCSLLGKTPGSRQPMYDIITGIIFVLGIGILIAHALDGLRS
jgi:hypothetical protein